MIGTQNSQLFINNTGNVTAYFWNIEDLLNTCIICLSMVLRDLYKFYNITRA